MGIVEIYSLDVGLGLKDGGWLDGMGTNVGVGHWLGHSLDNWSWSSNNWSSWGSNKWSSNWGSNSWSGLNNWSNWSWSSNWGGVWVSSIGTKVVVSVWVVGIRKSIVGIWSIWSIWVGIVSIKSIESISIGFSLWLSLGLTLDNGGGHVTESSGSGSSEEGRLDSAAMWGHTVMGAEGNWGGSWSNNWGNWSWSSNSSDDWRSKKWSVDNGSDWSWSSNSVNNWSSWSNNWGSVNNWSNWSWSGNSSDNWSWSSNSQRSNNWGGDSLGNWVNKTILVDILGESLQRDGSQTTLSGDKVTESSGQRSSNWSLVDNWGNWGEWSSIEEDLGISFSFSLVKSVD